MKYLCFIMYQFELGGCESVFTEVSKALNTPIDLVTATPNLNDDLLKKLPKNVRVIKHKEIPILSILSKLKWNRYMQLIYPLISMIIIPLFLKRRNRYKNVTYVNFSDTLSSLWIAVKSRGDKVVSWLQCRPKALLNSKNLHKYLRCLSKCWKIVCICETQKKEFLELYNGFKETQFKVIYNPVDINRIEALRIETVNIHKPYICMVSRLDERSKDFHTPIEAYDKLPSELKNKYDLRIIGDGPDLNILRQYIDFKGLSQNIFLQGSDINPYKWMNGAEFFLFSSKNEGLGVVILEAMACNKLVLATDCPVGPAEILTEKEESGILVEVGDTDSMSEWMRKILNGEIDAESYKRNAKRRLEDFSVERFKEKLLTLFKLNE